MRLTYRTIASKYVDRKRHTDVVKGTLFCLSSTLSDCTAAEIDFVILREGLLLTRESLVIFIQREGVKQIILLLFYHYCYFVTVQPSI